MQIVDNVVKFFEIIIGMVVIIGSFAIAIVTIPLWIIPYLIYEKRSDNNANL